jgi:hypothetical protein
MTIQAIEVGFQHQGEPRRDISPAALMVQMTLMANTDYSEHLQVQTSP